MIKWTEEKLQEEANKYKTRREFQKNSLQDLTGILMTIIN